MKNARIPSNFTTGSLIEIKTLQDFPTGECFLIQVYEHRTIEHEGDERSRTNPGHGYPAWTEKLLLVRQFVTKYQSEWNKKIQELYQADPERTDIIIFSTKRWGAQPRVQVDVRLEETDDEY